MAIENVTVSTAAQIVTFTDRDRNGFTATVALTRDELNFLLWKLDAAMTADAVRNVIVRPVALNNFDA